MRITWLVPFACSIVLVAQQTAEPPGGAPRPDPTKKASAPRRFDTFPVPDAPPLDVAAATKAAIAALLALQEGEDDAEFPYQGVYREDENASPVGYRVGGTSIACLGLIAAPGYAVDASRRDAVHRGLTFVLRMLDAPRMQEGFVKTYDVRGWGHVYALQLLLSLQDAKLVPEAQREAVTAKTAWLVTTLVDSAIPESGGWNYSRPRGYKNPANRASTFMTAPTLQALFHAKARGHVVPDAVVTQALDALERARAKPGGYGYGAAPQSQAELVDEQLSMMDKTASSAARAAVIETTLLLAGRGDANRLARAVDLFFEHWDALAIRKSQQGTHVMPYGIAPYYFLFGHVYAAQAIEHLTDEPARVRLRDKLRQVLANCREEDDTWNDRQFARSAGYGTALALLALHMPTLPKPCAWTPGDDAAKAAAEKAAAEKRGAAGDKKQ